MSCRGNMETRNNVNVIRPPLMTEWTQYLIYLIYLIISLAVINQLYQSSLTLFNSGLNCCSAYQDLLYIQQYKIWSDSVQMVGIFKRNWLMKDSHLHSFWYTSEWDYKQKCVNHRYRRCVGYLQSHTNKTFQWKASDLFPFLHISAFKEQMYKTHVPVPGESSATYTKKI